MRKANALGRALIKKEETLELEAYPDPGSDLGKACAKRGLPMREYRRIPEWPYLSGVPWTIGWGDTRNVYPGLRVTEEEAEIRFERAITSVERDVEILTKDIPLTDNQFSSLVSLAYNIGTDMNGNGIAEGLGDSTLLKKLRAGDFVGAAEQFDVWKKSKGQTLNGLIARRKRERELFESDFPRAT